MRWILLSLCAAFVVSTAQAHTAMPTLVLVSFEEQRPGTVDVKIDVDLTLLLGSPERYYKLATYPQDEQLEEVRRLLPQLLEALQLRIGAAPLALSLQAFSAARATRAEFLDSSTSKLSTFKFAGTLPPVPGPLKLIVPIGADVTYPIAYTVQIPAAHLSVTRWLDGGMHMSEPFQLAGKVPAGKLPPPAENSRVAASFSPDSMPWWKRLALYVRLGLQHIIPEGTDHILFVLGLFFLGISWAKLLSQTTVFTVAHATTLFLSTYGVLTLPAKYVEPAIAISIAVIALENVFRPKLGPGRLAIVFGFGLVHGLGFASSLSEIPFPEHDFLIALLGFNLGVDFGQLLVIAAAFLAVGWFRNKPWFRRRIAIPCSLAIAATGICWAIGRVIRYTVS
jgi:hypothetical protein